MEENKSFCIECQKAFSKPSNLNLHIKRKHPDKFKARVANKNLRTYLCEECGERFTTLIKCKIHMRSHQPVKRYNICPICKFRESRKNLITHFSEEHDIILDYENLQFSTIGEFTSWKDKLESEDAIKFVRKRGSYQSSKRATTNITFYCHRSGLFRTETSGKRLLKEQGSHKIDGYCPAELKLKISNEKFYVIYCKTHVGHTLDLRHIHLSYKEREFIAKKIASETPFSEILNEIHDSVTDSKLQRLHLLKRKDLHNIKKNFNWNNLSVSPQQDDDNISLEAWVNNPTISYTDDEDFDNSESYLLTDFSPIRKEEICISDAISKKKAHEGNLQSEVSEYFKKLVHYATKNIGTYEEFNAVKKLLVPVTLTLTSMKNNRELESKVVKNNQSNGQIEPKRRPFGSKKGRKNLS